MNQNLEYNKRQLNLIEKSIEEFEDGKLNTNDLILRLESLSNSLKNFDDNWKDRFSSAWGILEDTYSYAIDQGKAKLDDKDVIYINQGLNKIKALLKEY